MSVCVYVCMYVPSRVPPFKCLYAPTYKSPRSIFYGILDTLGKSYGQDVVSDLAILDRKWSKIAARKKFFLAHFQLSPYVLHFTGRIEAAQ